MEFDREKFKSLLHYVIAQAGEIEGFGATKLYKVMWFSDARAFMLHGQPITGESYVREKYGPMPRHVLAALAELEKEGAISIRKSNYYGRPTRRFKSLRSPDNLTVSPKEREIVSYWIKHIAHEHTATSISDESHDYVWEIAKLGEEIPYKAIFANRIREPKDNELEWAKNRAKALGLK